MRQEASKKLYHYWSGLRGSRPAPERSEIEPSDIRDILGDTFILEVSPRMRSISYRLAGTRLCGAHGRELKGLGFLALWQEDDNFEIAQAVQKVYQDFTPMLLSHTGATAQSRFAEFESILLPLMPTGEGDSRILGVTSPRKPPYWLGSEPIITNHLRMVRPVEPLTETPPLAPVDTFAGTGDGDSTPRRVAHLTVIEGGRD